MNVWGVGLIYTINCDLSGLAYIVAMFWVCECRRGVYKRHMYFVLYECVKGVCV